MTASIKPATSRSPEPFEFKSAALNLVAFTPFTADLADIESALTRRLGGRSDFFGGEGALLDLSQWPESATALDLSGLIALLRKAGLQPIGARAENDAARAVAQHAGLTVIPGSAIGRDQQREAKVPAVTVAAEPTPVSTLIIDKPVRSGQQIYARGGDLVVLALVSHCAEVIADGNVHVYAPLRGRALAGARGNAQARIFAHCMEAELLSVAGVYRAIDEPLPQSIKGRAAQVRLDGTKLVIEAMTLD